MEEGGAGWPGMNLDSKKTLKTWEGECRRTASTHCVPLCGGRRDQEVGTEASVCGGGGREGLK